MRHARRFRNDYISGRNKNDVLIGNDDDNRIIGRGGNDVLSGGAGNDFLFGGRGNDLLEGGQGSDYLNAGSGHDTLVFTLSDRNDSDADRYYGGSGRDKLRVELTEADLADDALVADLISFSEKLETGFSSSRWFSRGADSFKFESIGLSVRSIELLEIVVDGQVVDAGDLLLNAIDDAFTTLEGATLTGDLLANDRGARGDVTVALVGDAPEGLILNADGTFTYDTTVANGDLNSGDTRDITFNYQVTDASGNVSTATATVTINGTNEISSDTGIIIIGFEEENEHIISTNP